MTYRLLRSAYLISLLITATLVSVHTHAEEEWHFPPYYIYANVIGANFLAPETASKYDIVRGKNYSIVILSIRKELEDGSDKAQRAIVTGSSSDLVQTIPLKFREIDERNAIYYIAPLRFVDKEVRYFTITIDIDPDNVAPQTVKFKRQLHADES